MNASGSDQAPFKDTPIISIGMPVYNAGRYLRTAVQSILGQHFRSWELILIDDGSTDGSLETIADLQDARIRILRGTKNLGLAARLNEAISLARGKYFARMDQDDISHPERLERQLRFLELHPEVDIVGSRCLLIDGESRPSGVLQFPTEHKQLCRRPWRGIFLPHPTWMGQTEWFRRNLYRSPGPYFCEDQELLLRTHRTARFAVLPESYLAYRVKGPIPSGKLIRTRATIAAFQMRHFLSHKEPLNTFKAAMSLISKCVHDWAAPLVGRPAKSAHAGVPLESITERERARWKQVLPELPAEATDGTIANQQVLGCTRSNVEAAKTDKKGGSERDLLRPRTFWMLAFMFCCFQAVMVQKLVLPLLPGLHGGHGLLINDATIFHEAASAVADKIRSGGWSEWSLYPQTPGGNFSGNVAILAALYAVFGPEPAVFIPLNAAAHATGALMLYLIGPLLWPGRIGRLGGLVAATLFVIFPSSLQWYSQNHKDAFTIAGSLTMLYAWLLLLSSKPEHSLRVWQPLLMALGGVVIVLIMRPYLSVLLAAAFLFSGFVFWLASLPGRCLGVQSKGNALWVAAFLGIVCAGAFIGSVLPAAETALAKDVSLQHLPPTSETALREEVFMKLQSWQWKSLMPNVDLGKRPFEETFSFCLHTLEAPFKRISELRVHFIAYGNLAGARSGIDEDQIPDNFLHAILYLPRALVVGIFAPFPSSWLERVSLLRLAGAGETFVWYLFFIGVAALALMRPSKTLLTGVAFCAVLLTVVSYTNPNVGNLYRVRFGYWMFILLCGSVGWLGVLAPLLRRIAGGPEHKMGQKDAAATQNIVSPAGGLESLGIAGAVTMLLTFVGFLGFLGRDLLLINVSGMNEALDVFFSAAILPMVFVTCLAMPLADVLTKPFLAASDAGEKFRAAEIARGFLTIGCLAVLPCAALLLAFPGTVLGLVLGPHSDPAVAEGARLLRIMTPILIFGVFNIVGNAVLNAWKCSAQSAAAQLVVPLCAIGAILMVPRDQALTAAAIGMLCGAGLNAAVVAGLCSRRRVGLLPLFSLASLRDLDIQSYLWLALAAAFTALAVPVNFYFAGIVGAGSVSAWAFAGKIVTLFNSLFAFGVTAVVLPHLAAKFAGDESSAGRDHFFSLLIAGTWIGGAIALALSIFAEPLIFAVFSAGGQLTENQMLSLARVLRIGALQVPVAVAGAVVFKSVAVSGSSSRAVIASFAGLAINIFINQLLVQALGLQGIAIGVLVAAMVTTLVACAGSRARYGTSAWVGVILLFGWLVWAGAVWAIDARNILGLSGAVGGLVVLAILHVVVWKQQFHHRSALRKTAVSSR